MGKYYCRFKTRTSDMGNKKIRRWFDEEPTSDFLFKRLYILCLCSFISHKATIQLIHSDAIGIPFQLFSRFFVSHPDTFRVLMR